MEFRFSWKIYPQSVEECILSKYLLCLLSSSRKASFSTWSLLSLPKIPPFRIHLHFPSAHSSESAVNSRPLLSYRHISSVRLLQYAEEAGLPCRTSFHDRRRWTLCLTAWEPPLCNFHTTALLHFVDVVLPSSEQPQRKRLEPTEGMIILFRYFCTPELWKGRKNGRAKLWWDFGTLRGDQILMA